MHTRHIAVLAAVAMTVGACSAAKEHASDDNVGATASALTRSLTAHPLASINGTYQGCSQRTDGSGWSLHIGGAGALPHPQLTVVKNDTACHLDVTDIVSNIGGVYNVQGGTYQLADDWSAAARTFQQSATEYLYANVRLDDALYNDDFVVTVRYSDDANDTASTVNSNYAVVQGTATAERVPAPDYAIDLTSVVVQKDVADNIDTIVGTVGLMPNGQSAEDMVVVNGDIAGTTWVDVDQAFKAGTPQPAGNIGADQVAAPGTHLPATRVIILRHTLTGVPSYTTFTITFTP